ncbi:MAG: hypothetical protein R3Y13_02915 [bacterium]
MHITYIVIISIITYIMAAINDLFFDKIPSKYIPFQNILIGFISSVVCYYYGLFDDFFTSLIMCLYASVSVAGIREIELLLKNSKDV